MFNFFRHAIAVLLLCAVLPATAAPDKPNIVFILADDLDAAAAAQMPFVKSLIADQGMSFNRHYVSLSLCCPSRVTTLRGQFAHNTRIFTNDDARGGFSETYKSYLENETIAVWLKNAGYHTALFGKYLNGYPAVRPIDPYPRRPPPAPNYIPPGWEMWSSPIAGLPYKQKEYILNTNGVPEPHCMAGDEVCDEVEDYLNDVLTKKATDFIQLMQDGHPNDPFFLHLTPYSPHYPAPPAPRHRHAFDGLKAPQAPSFNEQDDSKPAWVRERARLTAAQLLAIDELYEHRRESLLAVDEMVKAVHDKLAAAGMLPYTYIFFASDNGYHQGQHKLDSGKDTAYEEDILVPLYVRGPGIPPMRTVNDLITANVDYAPTFAAIANAIPGYDMDGRSLLPILHDEAPPSWRRALLLEHKLPNNPNILEARVNGLLEPPDPFDDDNPTGIESFYGLRLAEGNRTYVEYGKTGECEIYDNDIAMDPYQQHNRCVPGSAETLALSAWLAAFKPLKGQALRDMELAPPPPNAPKSSRQTR